MPNWNIYIKDRLQNSVFCSVVWLPKGHQLQHSYEPRAFAAMPWNCSGSDFYWKRLLNNTCLLAGSLGLPLSCPPILDFPVLQMRNPTNIRESRIVKLKEQEKRVERIFLIRERLVAVVAVVVLVLHVNHPVCSGKSTHCSSRSPGFQKGLTIWILFQLFKPHDIIPGI